MHNVDTCFVLRKKFKFRELLIMRTLTNMGYCHKRKRDRHKSAYSL